MPKQRQIPRLFPQRLADGTTVYHWKPSKTLRAGGFTNQKLGVDKVAAIATAIELNDQVDAWQKGAPAGAPAPARQLPRIVRFAELVKRYRQHDDFTGLAKKTRDNYSTRLNQLETWALDGTLAVRDIDEELVADLREALLGEGRSIFVAAETLRVLRLLLGWAKRQRIVTRNAAAECRIPETPKRRVQMLRPVRAAIMEAADELGLDDVAFAITLSLWMIQRPADVAALSRFSWRSIDLGGLELDPRHAARLAGGNGDAKGFRLCQQKTGTWIDAPLPPWLCLQVEERFRASNNGYLFPDIEDHRFRERVVHDRPIPVWKFTRRFREAKEAAWCVAIGRGDELLAKAIADVRYRDLRRTGMIFYKDAGAPLPNITALSGHMVLGRKTILDDYMPGDTAGACACVAAGIRFEERRQQLEAMG